MKRVLYIDGSNIYASQYELFGPAFYLNFQRFIAQIEVSLKIQFTNIHVYGSFTPIPSQPTKKQKLQIKNEGLFYKTIRKIPNVIFFKGYRSPSSGKEKEVDVKLAVDIVNMTHENKFDEMYLFSGDADFMHALHIVKSKNKQITILAMPNRIPFRFIHHFKTVIFGDEKNLKKHSVLKKLNKVLYININFKELLEEC